MQASGFYRFSAIILLFIALASLGGCRTAPKSVKSIEAIDTRDTLRIGVSTNAPPIIYRQENSITGLEASLARTLGTYLNKKIVFVEVPWKKQLEYLNLGKTDIVMSGMTITPQRKYLATFTTPYLRSGQILLVRLEDRRKFSRGIVDLMNSPAKIGTIANTTGDFLVTETITNAHEIIFDRSAEAVEALIDERIDALVYDAPMVCHYAARSTSKKLVPVLVMATEEYLAWAVRKDEEELAKRINQFIKTISDSGELQREIKQWIPYLGG